jgi:head-tail adaptor
MVRVTVRDLDREVTFQSIGLVSDGAGGNVEGFTDVATVWGCIRATGNNKDSYQQGVEINKQGYLLYIRFEDFTPKISMQVKYTIDGVLMTMQIGGINELNDERKFYKITLINPTNG